MSLDIFAVYSPLTGRIVQSVQCPKDFMLCAPDEAFVKVDALLNPDDWYINGTVPTHRPGLPAKIVGGVLKGVPAGGIIQIEGALYTADGTDITLSFQFPGSYKITVACWPYKTWSTQYEVAPHR